MSSKNTFESDSSYLNLLIEAVSHVKKRLEKLDYYENIFLSFLHYNKEKDDFNSIDLINTTSIFRISKEYQEKGLQSYYYARQAINDKETIVCGNIHQKKCPWHKEIKDEAEDLGIKSVISSPVMFDEMPIGVVNTFYPKALRKNSPEKNQLMANGELTASLLGQQLWLMVRKSELTELAAITEQADRLATKEFPKAADKINESADKINEYADAIKLQISKLVNSKRYKIIKESYDKINSMPSHSRGENK